MGGILVKGAVLLDAGMSVQAAGRRLAQHGYWIDPNQRDARSWLEEYVARVTQLISRAGVLPPDGSDRESGGQAAISTTTVQAAAPTIEDAARLLARPHDDQWAAVRRQDGVTIFWYAKRVTKFLQAFSHAPSEQPVLEALEFHEYTSTPSIQVEDLPSSGPRLQVVLHGQDLVGIKEPPLHYPGFDSERSFRGDGDTAEGGVPATHRAEEATGVAVRGFPFLDAPPKVTVGVRFELEIGLSGEPVAGVATTGEMVLHAPPGTTTIPVEVQVIADGFSAPDGWRRMLDVAVGWRRPPRSKPSIALAPAPSWGRAVHSRAWIARRSRGNCARPAFATLTESSHKRRKPEHSRDRECRAHLSLLSGTCYAGADALRFPPHSPKDSRRVHTGRRLQ
jgi:Ternary complex associated domain 7